MSEPKNAIELAHYLRRHIGQLTPGQIASKIDALAPQPGLSEGQVRALYAKFDEHWETFASEYDKEMRGNRICARIAWVTAIDAALAASQANPATQPAAPQESMVEKWRLEHAEAQIRSYQGCIEAIQQVVRAQLGADSRWCDFDVLPSGVCEAINSARASLLAQAPTRTFLGS